MKTLLFLLISATLVMGQETRWLLNIHNGTSQVQGWPAGWFKIPAHFVTTNELAGEGYWTNYSGLYAGKWAGGLYTPNEPLSLWYTNMNDTQRLNHYKLFRPRYFAWESNRNWQATILPRAISNRLVTAKAQVDNLITRTNDPSNQIQNMTAAELLVWLRKEARFRAMQRKAEMFGIDPETGKLLGGGGGGLSRTLRP